MTGCRRRSQLRRRWQPRQQRKHRLRMPLLQLRPHPRLLLLLQFTNHDESQ